jgi:alkaline phosphatase D
MKTRLLILSMFLIGMLQAQTTHEQHDLGPGRSEVTTIIPEWAPFYHGVASGDPLHDQVIIWTRVTPDEMTGETVAVEWYVATDPDLSNIVRNGTFATSAERDYTVKVDVDGLMPGQTYYYAFSALGGNSLIGKTKTTPIGAAVDHLRFGVVSCSNFQAGYFNGYRRLADRTDLDAVIHLGDYIYEYASGIYGDSSLTAERALEPEAEIIDLADYRARYSTYRLDTALSRVHQQHPFITVWDDHESANDSYTSGAENHTEGEEGEWEDRKAIAKQVYFEWMPIRENPDGSIYRTLHYGDLMDLIMIDTRLEGRERQLADATAPELNDPNRTILGADQKAWLLDQLANSTARWKVVGQQVIFAELNVGWAALLDPTGPSFFELESVFLDIWDGYPAERDTILQFITDREIDNVVMLTGDFHTTMAFDLSSRPTTLTIQEIPGFGDVPIYGQSDEYDPLTGNGSQAVEFVTPSVTSANFDENVGLAIAQGFQAQINNPINVSGFQLGNPNPHLKYTDLIRHGYTVLDIRTDSTQADWFYTPIDTITTEEVAGESWYTLDEENHLQAAASVSPGKMVQDEPAPLDPPSMIVNTQEVRAPKSFALLAIQPNPFRLSQTLHYSLVEPAPVRISLHDANGRLLREVLNTRHQAGVFSLEVPANDLPAGIYFYQISVKNEMFTAKVIKK